MNDQQVTVATPSDAVMAMADDIQLARDLMGGTKAMRKAGAKYLPAWPNEDALTYKTRLSVSTLFPAYSRTVTTLTGKPFSKPITYSEEVPEQIKEWMEDDCDFQGRNLDTFAAGCLESALAYGLTGILVDAPTVMREVGEEKPITQAEEQAMGVRPYLIHIEPWNILGWRAERINGAQTLVQLRLREFATVNDGEFANKTIEQVRVLTRGGWSVHRKSEDGNWFEFQSGVTSIKRIPFVPVYGERTDFMQAKPPMLEMAHLNVKHWQSQSDQDNILHVSRVPILVVSGVDDDAFSMTIGASAAVKLPTGATAGFVEHSGAALGAGRLGLEDLKEEMRQAGAELLVVQQAQITATQVSTERSVGMCALQRIVQNTEDALDLALQFCAEFVNLPEGGNVTIFNDFSAANMNEASAQLLFQMRQAGDLSKETLLKEVQRRGILAADVDVEDELGKADADGPQLGDMGATDAQGSSTSEPVTAQQSPKPVEPVAPTVDLKPVLDAIASIPKAEPQEAPEADMTPVMDAISKLSSDVTALKAAATQPPRVDPALALKAMVDAAIAPLTVRLDGMAAKQEVKQFDQEAFRNTIRLDMNAALAASQTNQPTAQPVIFNTAQGARVIDLVRDASGSVTGAKVREA